MNAASSFPLQGVIGVIANGADEVDMAVENALSCVEIRADLLLTSGHTLDDVMAIVKQSRRQRLACLFTLRHPRHGGSFEGSETQRATISRQALDDGADIIDLEWNTEAAHELLGHGAPMILSYHDFERMPTVSELGSLTQHMMEAAPRAIKIVPTAHSLDDAARMLSWVAEGADHPVSRIGFAMGDAGRCSRILTIGYGAPITYASFGEPVAPGQVSIAELVDTYRAMTLNERTTVTAVVGAQAFTESTVARLNARFQADNNNRVAVAFAPGSLGELEALREALRIDRISVE